MSDGYPIWAEVDLAALRHNVAEVRRLVGTQTAVMAVVKANAYGHGLVPTARAFLEYGATWLGVARAGEGRELRRAGIEVPILILGYTPPEQYGIVLDDDLRQAVYDLEQARLLSDEAGRRGRTARVHIKVDTGMSRLGFWCDETIDRQIRAVARLPHLDVEGMFTHLATADEADKGYARRQLALFDTLAARLRAEEINLPCLHVANAASIIDLPESYYNLVRPGIMLYGLYPSEHVQRERAALQPALSLKARVGHVKRVPAGTKVSYGCTYTTPAATTLATVPAGYGDGYSRLLSNRADVLIHGQRAPVVGKVCMDQIIVDVGHVGQVVPGDEVVLFGRQGDAVLPVEELASIIGTINYEIICGLSARVPRVYINP